MFWTTTAKENKKCSAFGLTAKRCYGQLCALIVWTHTDLAAMRKHLPCVNTQVFTWKRVCQVGPRAPWAEIEESPREWANMPTATGRGLSSLTFKLHQGWALVKPSSPIGTRGRERLWSCLTRKLQHGSRP